MENKNTISTKKVLTIGIIAVIVALLFIPFPTIALEVFLGIELVYAFAVLIYSFLKHRKAMPNLVLVFAIFSLVINISITRATLLGYENGNQIPIVCFFANMLGENNFIVGFVISLILMVIHVMILTKGTSRVIEVTARFSLDSINQKFFDIDNNLAENQISEDEAEKQKKAVQNECEYYSRLDGTSKFLKGSTKATVSIILVNLLGGFAVESQILGAPFHECIEVVMRITTGNIVVFLLPALVVSFSLGLIITRIKR